MCEFCNRFMVSSSNSMNVVRRESDYMSSLHASGQCRLPINPERSRRFSRVCDLGGNPADGLG